MRALLWILPLVLAIPVAASSADGAGSLRDQAVILRSLRDRIDAATLADAALYEQYFEAFPPSFVDLRQMLVADQYKDILLRSGERWDYNQAYVTLMCRTFDHVDHRRYMRKILRIGVGADDWGAEDLEYQYAGDMYQRLIFRFSCAHQTEQSARAQMNVIYSLLPEFSDAQVTAIYHSLWWDEGGRRIRLDWLLNDVCSLYPSRCELTRKLRHSFPKESGTSHH